MKLKTIRRRINHPSGLKNLFEMSVWKTLQAVIKKINKKGTVVRYESRKFPYTLHRNYSPDFEIEKTDGTRVYIEAKGYLRPADRAKILAACRDNPDLDLRILFYQNKPLSKGSGNRYTDWAEKNGIPCAVGEIPEEWLE